MERADQNLPASIRYSETAERTGGRRVSGIVVQQKSCRLKFSELDVQMRD
jgi:hypothetical protein